MPNLTEVKNMLDELQKQYHDMRHDLCAQGEQPVHKMSKDEIIAATWKMPELPGSYMMQLKAEGFMTGSSVYGNPNTAADIDWCICIPSHVYAGWGVGSISGEYSETDDFQTVYAHYQGQLINIICFNNWELFQAWKSTTAILQSLIHDDVKINQACQVKWSRVRLFRAICDAIYPVNELPEWKQRLTKDEAVEYQKCVLCGREAINFTSKAKKDNWLLTGVCERHDK